MDDNEQSLVISGPDTVQAKRKPGNTIVCGDLHISADTFISAPSNAVLVIENGQLDTGNSLLQTTNASGLTVVFTGDPNNGAYLHYPTGGKSGFLDIAAPTSGPWKGVALYQDPNLIDIGGNLDITYKGNSPTWNITGLVYLPHSNTTFSGAVGKSSNASSGSALCFELVVSVLTINGTGSIFANDTQCPAAGLGSVTGLARGTLVN